MKKVHAWWVLVKQEAAAFASSATVKDDVAALKTDIEAMLPDLFNAAEASLAKILLQTL